MPTLQKWLAQPENRGLVWVLAIGLVVRGVIAIGLPPGFDEAYYYLYTRHLDWSYFDHPLLVALTTGLGVWLTGEVSAFTIRLGSLLLHTGSLLLLYWTGVRLFGFRAALLTATIASIAPIFLLGFGVLTLPDSPLIFFWTATLYVASGEFFRDSTYRPSGRLAIVGLLVGLTTLGKYHGLALGFGLLGFCITSSRCRVALRSPWLGAGMGLFLLAIAPILIWNGQHDWISLRFQSNRAVPDRGYSVLDLLVAWLVGIAYLFPTIGFPLWWVSGRAALGKLSNSNPNSSSKLHFLLWLSLPLMLGFTLMGGYRAILPTWPTPGFWSATLLLGWAAAGWRGGRRWLTGSTIAIASLLLVALLHVTLGIFQPTSQFALGGGFLPATTDASVQLLDIQQVRRQFASQPELSQALSRSQFVFTNEIYLAGQVGMAIAPLTTQPVTCFDPDLRGFAFWSTREQWVGQTGLYIATATLAQPDHYRPYFQRLDKVGELPLRRGGAIVQTLHVYQAVQLLRPYPRPYGL